MRLADKPIHPMFNSDGMPRLLEVDTDTFAEGITYKEALVLNLTKNSAIVAISHDVVDYELTSLRILLLTKKILQRMEEDNG